jgi:hypothetical protein
VSTSRTCAPGAAAVERMRDGHGRAAVAAAGGGVQDGDARPRTRGQRLDGDHAAAGRGEQHLVLARSRAQLPAPPRALGSQPRAPLGGELRKPQPAETRDPDHARQPVTALR